MCMYVCVCVCVYVCFYVCLYICIEKVSSSLSFFGQVKDDDFLKNLADVNSKEVCFTLNTGVLKGGGKFLFFLFFLIKL